jgi:vacuolar protein sorting-associated protein 11
MYGDHLYKKGDYEGAVQQYQHTIGHVEPSYVIQR